MPTASEVLASASTQPSRRWPPSTPRLRNGRNAAASMDERLYRKSEEVKVDACSRSSFPRKPCLGSNGSFVLSMDEVSVNGESRCCCRSAESVGWSHTPKLTQKYTSPASSRVSSNV